MAGSYADIITYGLKDSYWNDFVGEVKAMTPAKLTAAAQKLVHPGRAHLGDRRRSLEDRSRRAQAEPR